MSTVQKAQSWQDELGTVPTFREERANHIITALLAEREALLDALKPVGYHGEISAKIISNARKAIQLCKESK